MRKKILSTIIIFLLMISFCVSTNANIITKNKSIEADEIKLVYDFEKPTIKKVFSNSEIFDRINIKGLENNGNQGKPNLPVKGAYILIPNGKTVEDININCEKNKLNGKYLIEPVSKKTIISDEEKIVPKIDSKTYEMDTLFPSKPYEKIEIFSFRGYNILVLNIYPVQYLPSKKEIYYHNFIEFNIKLSNEKNKNNDYLRNLEKDSFEVSKIVDNPSYISSYNSNHLKASNNMDLLILTTEELKSGFQPLSNYHNNNGIKTVIKTMSDIEGDTSEDVKDFLKDSYNNLGISYVLLGSDVPNIPVHYVEAYNPALRQNEMIPSDQWYSLLDDDMMPEVYIGRACVDDLTEVSNFVSKTISYISSNSVENYDKCLMVGQKLMPLTYGGNYMDELINSCDTNGFSTVGIPETRYHMDKLYERYETWEKNELVNLINNNNYHLINHLGHGHFYHLMKLEEPFSRTNNGNYVESRDVSNLLKNNKPFFLYTQACYAGSFDNMDDKGNSYEEDCIGEYITFKTNNGAFASIMNSRYGLGALMQTLGPNQFFHREFWDSVFDDNILEIGKAHQFSKIKNLDNWGFEGIPYSYWETNLLGDPTVSFKVPSVKYPYQPDRPEFFGLNKTNLDITFTSNAVDPNNLELSYLFDWDDGSNSGWIGPYESGEEVSSEHSWENEGDYLVRVKAKNNEGFESQWSEPAKVSVSKVKAKNFENVFSYLLNFDFLEYFLKYFF